MSSLRKLLVLALMLGLFTVVGASQACCGEAPNYFINVSVVGTPICDYRNNTGRVNWTMNYHLPTAHSTHADAYGDGVAQSSDYFGVLPHTAGASVDTLSSYSIWNWAAPAPRPRGSSYKVRVQFEVHNISIGFEDWALIVFDCSASGVATNVVVHNGP